MSLRVIIEKTRNLTGVASTDVLLNLDYWLAPKRDIALEIALPCFALPLPPKKMMFCILHLPLRSLDMFGPLSCCDDLSKRYAGGSLQVLYLQERERERDKKHVHMPSCFPTMCTVHANV